MKNTQLFLRVLIKKGDIIKVIISEKTMTKKLLIFQQGYGIIKLTLGGKKYE